nr:hypothetical protein [Tanacetum cinerariifolium]
MHKLWCINAQMREYYCGFCKSYDDVCNNSIQTTLRSSSIVTNVAEAANLRFMPECFAYIFHHLAVSGWRFR